MENIALRNDIEKFSELVENHPESLGEDPFPLFHYFSDGLYAREIHLPAGYVLVGKIHRHESMVYMPRGKVIVADESGTRTVSGPIKFLSKPGIKRVGYVLEDVIWIDVHKTDKTTVEDAEKEIFVGSYAELEYENMVNSLGFTVDEVREISERKDDIVHVDNKRIQIRKSEIEGHGIFSMVDLKPGETLGEARIGDNRTDLGRYTNHSFTPNVRPEIKNNSIYYNAVQSIKIGDEITIDYRTARQAATELDSMKTQNTGWLACQA